MTKLFINLLLIFLSFSVVGTAEDELKEGFSDTITKLSKWRSRWDIGKGVIKTKDGLHTFSRFELENLSLDHFSLNLNYKLLKLNPKGSLIGCKLSFSNNTTLHIYIQGAMVKSSIKNVKEEKQDLLNFSKKQKNSEMNDFKFNYEKGKLLCEVNGLASKPVEYGSSFVEKAKVIKIEFHAYNCDMEYDNIHVFNLDPSKTLAKAGDARLSQLDVVEERPIIKDEKAYRILYIGDSITRHSFSKSTIRKLGWGHVAGMAATHEDKDYAHLVADGIRKEYPEKDVYLYFHSKGGSGAAAHRLSVIDDFQKIEPALVVIQLGEHEKEAVGIEAFSANYTSLIKKIQAWPSSTKIICTGVWNPYKAGVIQQYQGWVHTLETTMQKICQTLNVPFASVQSYALDPNCSGYGTSGGVRWHPNNNGMKGYAEAILTQFQKIK